MIAVAVAVAVSLLAACDGGAPVSGAASDPSQLPSQSPTDFIGAKPTAIERPLYGQHIPHGRAAVDYLLGSSGTWRDQSGIRYGWNYYAHCATPSHPHNRRALLIESAVTNSTAPDANCILFGDKNSNGELSDDDVGGYAFHEHAGRGPGGELVEEPFYHFWFDDNWLARYVTDAYERPPPSGLHDLTHHVRWRVLGGDNSHWEPYGPSQHADKVALNGILKINGGDFAGALADWQAIKHLSAAVFDPAERRHLYSFARESIYYLGLWAILSERLLAAHSDFAERSDVLQHAVSLHSALLALQETNASGERLGWRTGTISRALINTETTAIAVLALAANASWALEPGHPPLQNSEGYYVRNSDDGLSAVAGQSPPGYMVLGPHWSLPPGTYDVEFTLRTASNGITAALATLDVHAGVDPLVSTIIDHRNAPRPKEWQRYRLTTRIGDNSRPIDFRVFWHGYYDLDVGTVRVTRHIESLD